MKFTLAVEKKNRSNIGTVEGHNSRAHPTSSQLPESAWFTPQGWHQVIAFDKNLMEKSKGLAKRKDAVLAVEMVIGVGNQTDWRDLPTAEHPYGKPKPGASAKLNALVAGVKAAAIAEFGKERIISVDLHTDESTPHVHLVFAPINEGKLQAKKWLDGPAAVGFLREKIHAHVNKTIPCDYEKGAPGGAPHDASKAAGGVNAPKPEPGFIEKTADKLTGRSVIEQLKATIAGLNQQLQTMFSKLKSAEKRAADELALREKAIKKMHETRELAEKQKQEIEVLQQKIVALTPKVEAKKPLESKFSSILSELKPAVLAPKTGPKL
jgi:ElaB/YqjD/DUF883 family membrane-anchored ribosome-binding protein